MYENNYFAEFIIANFSKKKPNFVELTLFLAIFFTKYVEKSTKILFCGIYFRGFDKIKNFAGTYFCGFLPKKSNKKGNKKDVIFKILRSFTI